MDNVPALFLEVDTLFPDAADEQHKGVVIVVEVASVGFSVAAIGAVVTTHQVYRAAVLKQENSLLLRNLQAVVLVHTQVRLFAEIVVHYAAQGEVHRAYASQ